MRRKPTTEAGSLQGTVVAVTDDSVLFDIGYKTEGILPLSVFQNAGESVKPGDKFPVSVKGRDPEGYYELTRFKVARPKDWTALERAFAEKSTIVGTVTAQVKGGFSVDVGVRAFMPASRSGVRDAAEMEKLVGQEIRCRITKLDVTEEDLVVDRRAVLEEEERSAKERRYTELNEGDIVPARCAASPITAPSSTSAASTACCTSPISPGVASTSLPTCSPPDRRSKSRS